MNDLQAIVLLTCPFCCRDDQLSIQRMGLDIEDDNEEDDVGVVMFVSCNNCGARGPITAYETTAKMLWNVAHVNARPQFFLRTADPKVK